MKTRQFTSKDMSARDEAVRWIEENNIRFRRIRVHNGETGTVVTVEYEDA